MRRVQFLLLAIVLAACSAKALFPTVPGGGSGTGSGTGTGTGSGAGGSMSATINGVNWAAAANPSVVHSNNIFTMAGLDLTYGVTIGIAQITTAGTYSLTYPGSLGSSGIVSNTTGGWDTYLPGGTGTVTFTTFTAGHVVGTFSFDAVSASGSASGTVHVTNGKFDVTY